MKYRRITALMIAFLLLVQFLALPVYAAEPEEIQETDLQTETEPQMPPWVVPLPNGLVVGENENIVYQTIAAGMLPEPKDGYYPGGVTIEAGGQLVVEAGGSLTIGKLSVGGAEPNPVLKGTLQEDGLIRVKPGGQLILIETIFDTVGEGLAVWQEDGGIVEACGTDLTGLIHWGAPVINNAYERATSLWLEAGTPLTSELLPTEKQVTLIENGEQSYPTLSVRWDIPQDVATDEVTLSGVYLDENGDAVLSFKPLTMTVHWYTPESIELTDTAWYGEEVPVARLYVNTLPEDADLWAEYSEDDGSSWTPLEIYSINEDTCCCIINPPDSTPRLYRLAAKSWDNTQHWVSDSVLLPAEETHPDDSGGNRGGSTDPTPPDREPTPPQDSTDPTPSDREPTPPQDSTIPEVPDNTTGTPDGDTSEPDDDPANTYRPTRPKHKPNPVEEPEVKPDSAPPLAPTLVPSLDTDAFLEPQPPIDTPSAVPEPDQTNGLWNAPAQNPEPEDPSPAKRTEEQKQGTPNTDTSDTEPTAEPSETAPQSPAISFRTDVPAETPATSEQLPTTLQGALVVAGLAGCALTGGGITRALLRYKKKK